VKIAWRTTRRGLLGLAAFFGSTDIHFAQTVPHFAPPPSAGEAIKAATQAAAASRVSTGPIDILSDTQGVDFGPYLRGVVQQVRTHWYLLIPASVQQEKGKLAIEFAIRKDGRVADMRLVASSGDAALDRPAWGSITASDPFTPLPSEFSGPYLALRFRFYYNPDSTDLSKPKITHAVLIQTDSNPLKYPKDALDAKIEGMVRLEGMVGTNGQIKDLRVMEGDKDLAAAATGAISRWRFHPAKRNGKHIEEPVHINVVFRLNGEQVRTQVFNVVGELK